jgi:methyl-accepting chemotaxis protein
MATPHEKADRCIGIVGGGNAGHRLFNLLNRSHLARPVFVVDPRHDAPAILAARESGVPTYTEVSMAVKNSRANIIFELVGRPEVTEQLREATQATDIRVVDNEVAYSILAVTEEDQQRTRDEVAGEMTQIEKEMRQSLDGSQQVVSQINQIMNGLQMLALNASIEAAKVGIHGKGFMVVADHMAKSVDAVRKMTHEIEAMNGNIQKVSERIDVALERLK